MVMMTATMTKVMTEMMMMIEMMMKSIFGVTSAPAAAFATVFVQLEKPNPQYHDDDHEKKRENGCIC